MVHNHIVRSQIAFGFMSYKHLWSQKKKRSLTFFDFVPATLSSILGKYIFEINIFDCKCVHNGWSFPFYSEKERILFMKIPFKSNPKLLANIPVTIYW